MKNLKALNADPVTPVRDWFKWEFLRKRTHIPS
jgi:hypothetical protein